MVSTSKAVILPVEQGVGQGDVFKDVKYSYIDSEDDDSVEVMELLHIWTTLKAEKHQLL